MKVQGADPGDEWYSDRMKKILADQITAKLRKQMISEPAQNFTLNDLDDNSVSLSGLKGKIVVLHFWAIWSGSSKHSFPAIKIALEKFRDDPDVRFLFIHTWERKKNAVDSVRRFMMRRHYPFRILMDLKDENGNHEVAQKYKVEGIPSIFVIDASGMIRFNLIGMEDSGDAAVQQALIMIDLVQKESKGL